MAPHFCPFCTHFIKRGAIGPFWWPCLYKSRVFPGEISDLFSMLFLFHFTLFIIVIVHVLWQTTVKPVHNGHSMEKQQANSGNCGPPLGNKFDLEVGQRSPSRSRHGTIGKVLSQRTHMPNIKALPVIVQKLWPRLKFLWQTDRQTEGRTDEWDLMSPRFRESGGQKVAVVGRWPLYRGSKFSRPSHLFSFIQILMAFSKGLLSQH